MKMRKLSLRIAMAFAIILATASYAGAGAMLADLENALMCKCDDKCGKVLINCTCSTADETRAKFSTALESGLTVDQIIQMQVDKYGETVLSAPTKNGFNLTAWITPFIALLAGGLGITKIIDLWIRKKRGVVEAEEKESDSGDISGKYSARLREELDKIEL